MKTTNQNRTVIDDRMSIGTISASRLRFCFILTITLVVVSSWPIIVLNSPLLAKTSLTLLPTISTIPSAPSTIGQDGKDGDLTTQAALQIPRTLQSNDLVNSLAFYEVTFITTTTGAIDKIRMDFPAGTGVGAAGIIERVGIGGGTLLKSGSSITYDVTSPINIPAGTFIRLEMFGIKNPINPSTTFTAMITTRDSGGNLIDGPSQTNVYTIKKIVSSDLADGSITSTKPAESFMKRVTVLDDAAGNAVGWNPNGAIDEFLIFDSAATTENEGYVSTSVGGGDNYCNAAVQSGLGRFGLDCQIAPPEGTTLRYVITNLPAHVVQ